MTSAVSGVGKSTACEYIKGQIDYQNYLLKNIGLYQMHVDNTEDVVENVTRKIADFIKQRK